MAVDRGGLQYKITVDFDPRPTRQFREELRESRRAFRDFQKGAGTGNRERLRSFKRTIRALRRQQQAIGAAARAEQQRERTARRIATQQQRDASAEVSRNVARIRRIEQIGKAQVKAHRVEQRAADQRRRAAERDSRARVRALEKEQRAQARNIQAGQNAARQRERQFATLRAAQKREAASRLTEQRRIEAATQRRRKEEERANTQRLSAQQSVDPQFQANKRINEQLFERTVLLRQIETLRTRAQASFATGDTTGGRALARQAGELKRQLVGANVAGNQLLFTFRRLFGVLAAFTAARLLLRGFIDTIRAGIQFQDTIKGVEIGVGALISAVADVRNEVGQTVGASEELARAQLEARKQTQLLRQDALATTATFEQLLDTFQVAVAPGLTAGLDINQVREFTVQISQAAGALGVAQNQLSEEIRSILSGTIQARTTRIATALGITNEDIRRLKEAGTLFEFLSKRFEAFAEAGEKAARQTFRGITNLLKGAFREVLGQAAEPLFQTLLDQFNDLFDNVVVIKDEIGRIRPNPQLVAVFTQLFAVLERGVLLGRRFAESIGFEGLASGVGTFSLALLTGLEVAFGAAQVLAAVFLGIFETIGDIRDAIGITNRNIGQLAGAAGAALGAFVAIKPIMRALALDSILLTTNIKALPTALAASGKAISTGIVGPLLVAVAAVAAVGFAFKSITEQIFGVTFTIKDLIDLLGLGLAGAIQNVTSGISALGTLIAAAFVDAFLSAKATVENFLREAQIALAKALGNDEKASNLRRADIQAEARAQLEADARVKKFKDDIAQQREQDTNTQLALEEKIAALVGQAASRAALPDDARDRFGAEFEKLLADARQQAEAVSEAFGDFGGPISTANQEIAKLSSKLAELETNARSARFEFEAIRRTADSTGVGGEIRSAFGDVAIGAAEATRGIDEATKKAEERLAQIREEALLHGRTAQGIAESVSLTQDLRDLDGARVIVLERATELATTQAAIIAARTVPAMERENELLGVQAVAERRIADAVQRRASAREQDVIRAENSLALARAEATQQESIAEAQIADVQFARNRATGNEAERLDALLDALRNRLSIEKAIAKAKRDQLAEELRLADLVANGSTGQGLGEGFRNFADQFGSEFNAGIKIAEGATRQFATLASTLISDAFDPTTDVSIEERIGRFLQSVAQLISQTIIENGLANAIEGVFDTGAEAAKSTAEAAPIQAAATALSLPATTLAGAGTTLVAASTGFAASGPILAGAGTTLATAAVTWAPVATELVAAGGLLLAAAQLQVVTSSLSAGAGHDGGSIANIHANARGYRDGGKIQGKSAPKSARPRGIHHSDKVPIWAGKDEFMFSGKAVRAAGLPFLNNLHAMLRGSISAGPQALRMPGEFGMAEGGAVPENMRRTSEALAGLSAGGTSSGGGPTRAFMVADEAMADRIFSSGRSAFLRFARANADTLSSIINRR